VINTVFRIQFQACITEELTQSAEQPHYLMGKPDEYQDTIRKCQVPKWWQAIMNMNRLRSPF